MNILICVPSLCIGGAEKMVEQLVENIDNVKYNVKLVVLSAKLNTYIEKEIEQRNIDITYINKKVGPSLVAIIKATNISRGFKPDIIHTHLSSFFYLVPYAIMMKIKILHTVHSRPIFEAGGIRRKIVDYFYKKQIGIPVAISDMIAKEIAEVYKLNTKTIETVYNPVNINKFSLQVEKRFLKSINFINVARFVEPKNHIELIQAFKYVNDNNKNTKLILVGDGPLRQKIENKIKQLDLCGYVELTGNVPNVEYYLSSSDVFVLPSIYEGLPLTVLEAMAAGLPVIATSVGGIPDIVKDNGILVEPGNREELVLSMLELANNSDARMKMGEVAKKEVQKYDISKVTLKYEELYKKYAKVR